MDYPLYPAEQAEKAQEFGYVPGYPPPLKSPLAYVGVCRDREVARLTLIAEKTKEGYSLEYSISEDFSLGGGKAASLFGAMLPDIEREFLDRLNKPSE